MTSRRRSSPGSQRGELETAKSVKIFAINQATNVCTYVWRIGWGATSFYVSPVGPSLGALKVSLHGPDPRPEHPRPGFKWELDLARYSPDEAVSIWDTNELPRHWFPGVLINDTVVHAVRLRLGWETMQRFNPSGPQPKDPRPRDEARVLKDIPTGYAADIDLYVSTGQPYWPNLEAAVRADAYIPPLKNRAGEYLTAIPTKTFMLTEPSPDGVQMPSALSSQDRIRGVGMAVAKDGLLWVAESITSRQALLAAAAELGTLSSGAQVDDEGAAGSES